MHVSVFRHRSVSGGYVVEFETLDELKERAGEKLDITVGVIFNDRGAIIQDIRFIEPSSTLYVDEAGVADFRRGSHTNDLRYRNIQQQRQQLEILLGKFLRASQKLSLDRHLIEHAVREVLRYMANEFGVYVLVTGVAGESIKQALSDESKLNTESKQLVYDMLSLISNYNELSNGAFKTEVGDWTRNVRSRRD